MNNIFVISLAVVSSLSVEMTSCSSTNVYDENAESNLKTDEYKSNWTKLIGSIDPNQDWNMMTKRNITVDIHLGLSGSYKINLYKKIYVGYICVSFLNNSTFCLISEIKLFKQIISNFSIFG